MGGRRVVQEIISETSGYLTPGYQIRVIRHRSTRRRRPIRRSHRPADPDRVVCAYTLDRWQDIVSLLQSLRDQERRPDQMVLVTDHNPELRERARPTSRTSR